MQRAKAAKYVNVMKWVRENTATEGSLLRDYQLLKENDKTWFNNKPTPVSDLHVHTADGRLSEFILYTVRLRLRLMLRHSLSSRSALGLSSASA